MNPLEYREITKGEFEAFLSKHYYWYELSELSDDLYKYDWVQDEDEWIYKENEIKEYCYVIPIAHDRSIKIYSSINRFGIDREVSRKRGEDSIKLIAVDTESLRPIHERFKHLNRVGDWRKRLSQRVEEIVQQLGNDMICPRCGSSQKIRKNIMDKKNFLGCSNYPGCRVSSDILIYGINRNRIL